MMEKSIIVLAIGTSILVFLYLKLNALVIQQRRKIRCLFKDCDDQTLTAFIRAAANFAEYVPLTLFLMALAIVLRIPYHFLSTLMLLLIIGRYLHAFALINFKSRLSLRCRQLGMALTFLPMFVLSIYNLVKSVLYLFNL